MNKHFHYSYPPDDNLDDLRRLLRDNAAMVARTLLGPENRKHSTRRQLRFGRDKGSLSVEIAGRNAGTWFDWADSQGGDLFRLIEYVRGCNFSEAKCIAAEITGATTSTARPSRSRLIYPRKIERADLGTLKYGGMIWQQSVDPRGTIAEEYLRSRGLEIADDIAGSVIRYHPPFYCAGRTAAAMIALFRDIKTNEACGVSVTFLTKDAKKLDRRFFGKVGNGAIKFGDVTNTLSIGEGIESTLSGMAMGYSPSWAVGSAGSIARFPVIEGITTLKIFGEKNDNGANANAIKELVKRWKNSGADIYAIEPKNGNDLNDTLIV